MKLHLIFQAKKRIKELQELAEKRGYNKSIPSAPNGSQYARPFTDFMSPNEKIEYNKLSWSIRKFGTLQKGEKWT